MAVVVSFCLQTKRGSVLDATFLNFLTITITITSSQSSPSSSSCYSNLAAIPFAALPITHAHSCCTHTTCARHHNAPPPCTQNNQQTKPKQNKTKHRQSKLTQLGQTSNVLALLVANLGGLLQLRLVDRHDCVQGCVLRVRCGKCEGGFFFRSTWMKKKKKK